MSKRNASNRNRLIVAALVTLPLAGLAYAGGHGMGGKSYGGGQDCDRDGRAMHQRHGGKEMGQHVEGRIAFLKAELAITDEQSPQWQVLEETMREGMGARAEMREERREMRAGGGDLSAPERIAAHVEAMEARLVHMKSMQAALDDLYAVLTPEQQKTADDLLPGYGPMRGRHM